MYIKFAFAFLALLLFNVSVQTAFSQINCDGKKLFSEKICLGDELTTQERELYKIVNDYRAQNGLAKVPLSESLSALANRHLLDLTINIKSFTHGWSNCPYDIKNEKTWNCVIESPKRLNTGYTGEGYENLYRDKAGKATPSSALEAWKKSDLHNSLILNLNVWKNKQWDAFGIAINGEYVALWFGSTGNSSGITKTSNLSAALDKYISNLSGVADIKKIPSKSDKVYNAATADKSVALVVSGSNDDISEASVTIGLKLEANSKLGAKNRNILKVFLNNLASEWQEREVWIDASLNKIRLDAKSEQTLTRSSKWFKLYKAGNYIQLTVRHIK